MSLSTLAVFEHSGHVAQVLRICQLVPSIVALYDHAITLEREIDLVWNKPYTFARIMFTCNRYFGTLLLVASAILFVIEPPSNKLYVPLFLQACLKTGVDTLSPVVWATTILVWTVQFVMLCRTIAIYRQKKIVIAACVSCYVAQIVAMSLIFALSDGAFEAHRDAFPGVFICTPRRVPRFYRGIWIPSIAFDCTICVLSLQAFLHNSPQLRDVMIVRSPMWLVLREDTFKFYIVILTISTANAVVWFVAAPEWHRLLQGMFTAAICVMGGRLVLSLRRAYYRYTPRQTDSDSGETTRFERSERFEFSHSPLQEGGVIPLQDMHVHEDSERPHRSSQCSEYPRPPTALDIGIA